MMSSPARSAYFWIQVIAGIAVIGIGAYLAATDRWAIGGIAGGVGLSILPFRAAGLIGAVVCLGFASAGYFLGRITLLVAGLVALLSVVTLADRVRSLADRSPSDTA